MTRIYHVSDLHFGHAAVPEQIDAIEEQIRVGDFDVVAISGDLSQRARSGEFLRARAFIRDAERVAKVIVVPGNHDVRWWQAPMGIGSERSITEHYRRYVSEDLEPVLRLPDCTIVGLNTAQGVMPRTLTWRMKDISIIGHLRKAQLDRAREHFADCDDSCCRVVMIHHNPVRGELSGRHGLKNTSRHLGEFAAMGVELILCGHDHQEAIHYVEHTRKGTVVSTAGTVSNRSRGGRPSSVNIIDITASEIVVTTFVWSEEHGAFRHGPDKRFRR